MNDKGMQNAANIAMPHQQQEASFSHANISSYPQPSLATRSYSDLGPISNSTIRGAVHASLHPLPHSLHHHHHHHHHHEEGEEKDEANEGASVESKNGNIMSPRDMVFYQQYNNMYRVTEVEVGAQGYYPCSYGGAGIGRGGPGSWSLRLDPEVKRKGRLAGYRAIAFEGKMKSSMKKSFKWFKLKCISLLPGHSTPPPTASSSDGITPHA